MRVLLVEDDEQTARFVADGLRREGFAVDHAADGRTGLHLGLTEPYDAAVLDVMLPDLDGLALLETLRGQGRTFPVLVLSAKASVDDRVRGLQAGSDDYLTKPFAFVELVARLQALIRRATQSPDPVHLTVGDLQLDLVRHRVARRGRPIDLQPKEFALLAYLMRHAGRVVSKTMIMQHVWDYDFDPGTTVVESRICRLRDKVDRPFGGQMIRTVRGVGYVLDADA